MSKKKSLFMIAIALAAGITIGVFSTLDFRGALTATVTDTLPEWVQEAGVPEERNGYITYVDDKGWCSAVIGEEDITWVYVEDTLSGDTLGGYWFGLSNCRDMSGTPLFESGSRLSVRLINRADLEHESDYYRQLDDVGAARVAQYESFLQVEVYNTNGELCTNFADTAKLYINDTFSESFSDLEELNTEDEDVVCYRSVLDSDTAPEAGRYRIYLISGSFTCALS